MTGIIQKYWIILIVLGLFIIAAFSWLVLSNNNKKKFPSKGVFVIHKILSDKPAVNEKYRGRIL